MERAEIMSQILAILEDVAEISPEDVNENSVMSTGNKILRFLGCILSSSS